MDKLNTAGKLNVVVLFGGCSEEHDISIKSARQIAAAIDTEKYSLYYIYISKKGEWQLCKHPEELSDNGRFLQAFISPDKNDHSILVCKKVGWEKIHIDVVFPVIHGKMGEDGQIQGLLEMSGIPYVGCDIESSVIGMDKSLAHLVSRKAGVVTPEVCIIHGNDEPDIGSLDFPVFVKPARSGSSFGVSKVNDESELAEAVATARLYDKKVLIEEAISGYEVGCAVMGNGDELSTGEIDMITLSHGFFKIHQEKNPEQGSENATITVPADIPVETSTLIKETAKKVYRALGCCGLARVDMFLKEDGTVVLNEINTMPGCTSYSRYPRMMNAAGIDFSSMIDKVITLALASI